MNILLIVNESPWGSTLANTALRFVRAAQADGSRVVAVFFHGDGVYNVIDGTAADAGSLDLAAEWSDLAEQYDVGLLVCSGAAVRRLAENDDGMTDRGFREAGLVELLGVMERCERVVTF